jgi:hypothetical protein
MNRKNSTIPNLVFSTLASVAPDRIFVYAAVPVSSGLRLWQLAKRLGLHKPEEAISKRPSVYRRKVLSPNIAAANRFVKSLRARYSYVINPAQLDVPGWQQSDYDDLWRRVIGEKVRLLVLSRNWAYSRGCVSELLFALEAGLEIREHNGSRLKIDDAAAQLQQALRQSIEYNLDVPFLHSAYHAASRWR